MRRKHRKRQKEKQRKKKGKSKAKGCSKRSHERKSYDFTSDEEVEHSVSKQKYSLNQHANPYFTCFVDPYSFDLHPSTRITTPFPFQSGYGMYGADTVFAQLYNRFVLHGPANYVNVSTSVPMGSGYNTDTPNNTSLAKQEFITTTNVPQSPSSETIAKTLLELGSNPRLNSNYDDWFEQSFI